LYCNGFNNGEYPTALWRLSAESYGNIVYCAGRHLFNNLHSIICKTKSLEKQDNRKHGRVSKMKKEDPTCGNGDDDEVTDAEITQLKKQAKATIKKAAIFYFVWSVAFIILGVLDLINIFYPAFLNKNADDPLWAFIVRAVIYSAGGITLLIISILMFKKVKMLEQK
jgi:hypothetical protein